MRNAYQPPLQKIPYFILRHLKETQKTDRGKGNKINARTQIRIVTRDFRIYLRSSFEKIKLKRKSNYARR